jgi:hypothetical protein
MNNFVKIVFCTLILISFASCKKEAGPGGKNVINGTVHFRNGVSGNEDPAPMAKIFIAYGTDQVTTNFDQTILSNADGSFNIEGLRKGKYFIRSEYTDAHGFVYSAPGYGIEFSQRKRGVDINMVLE